MDRSAGGQADVRQRGHSARRPLVLDIGGNKYRLVAWTNCHYGVVYVRFVGTHREYDEIDAQTL